MASRYHSHWRSLIRPLILLSDNFTCCVCGHKCTSNNVDHIDRNPGNNTSKNLRTLCSKCHALVTYGLLKPCQSERSTAEEIDDQIFFIVKCTQQARVKIQENSRKYKPRF